MAVKSSRKGIKPQSNLSTSIPRWSIALFLFAFLLNIDTLRYEFTFDDPLVVAQNKFVDQGWTALPKIFTTANLEGYNGLKESNYRPFSIAQFAIERSLLGREPGGFHFMHLLYYALGCLLVFKFLILIFKNYPVWLPVSITALFIAHPLHTEVVANLKSRDEITALIGIVATLLLIIKQEPFRIRQTILVFLCALIAFFSKESALPLVVVAPLTVFYFNPKGIRDRLQPLVAIGLAALIYLVMRQFVAEVPPPDFKLEDNALFAFEYPERIMAAMALIAHYTWLFLFPFKLRADYSFDHLHLTGWTDIWSYAGLVIFGLAVYLLIKGLRSKSIAGYAIAFSALFYVVTSNLFIMTGATLAERFLFVPSLGLLTLFGSYLFEGYKKQKVTESMAILICTGLVVLYSIRTLVRNPDWQDNPHIFSVTARDCPRSVRALTKQARIKYEEAIRINNPVTKTKFFSESITYLDASMKIYDRYALTHFVYGIVQKEQKNYKAAIGSILKAISIKPTDGTFDLNLGLVYVQTNEDSLALTYFQRASDKGVSTINLYDERAKIYLKQRRFGDAITEYKKMMDIKPSQRYALSQITKIYRDQLNDLNNAQLYNDQLKKVIDAEKKN